MIFLVPLDFSPSTKEVLKVVSNLAGKEKDKLVLLHVAEPTPPSTRGKSGSDTGHSKIEEEFKKEHQAIQAEANRLREEGFDATANLIQGPVVKLILNAANHHHADIIVMGSHGHSAIYQILMGSVSEGVLHESPIPVLFVPPAKQ